MSFWIIPASIALLLKLVLGLFASYKPNVNRYWLGFVAIFVIHNTTELLNIAMSDLNHPPIWLAKSYYVCSLFVAAYSVIYAFEWCTKPRIKISSFALSFVVLILASIILFSDAIVVSNITTLGSVHTADQGKYFTIFVIVLSLLCVATICGAALGYKREKVPALQIVAVYKLVGIVPLALVAAVISVLMSYGFQVNAFGLIPVASTFFLVVTYFGAGAVKIKSDPRRWIPGSLENDFHAKLIEISHDFSSEDIGLPETLSRFEMAALEYKHDLFEGNVSHAVNSMKIPRSTFYSKVNKLNMNIK